MSPTAPGGNVGEHEWFQFGAGVGYGTVTVRQKWDEGSFNKRHNKSRKIGECDDIEPKITGKVGNFEDKK